MTANTKIEWADHTFNPWIGCTKVSPACLHCYAEAQDKFRGWTPEGWGGPRKRTSADTWAHPLKWNAKPFYQCSHCGQRGVAADFSEPCTAGRSGLHWLQAARCRVFCASLADVFDNQVPIEWFVDLLDLIRTTPELDWLLLTKRIGNWRGRLNEALEHLRRTVETITEVVQDLVDWISAWLKGKAPAQVSLGATIVNQEEADRDIPKLLATPAWVRFLSMEPLLGLVDLQRPCTARCPNRSCWSEGHLNERLVIDSESGGFVFECICSRLNGLHWVIVGGESGAGARPMHPDWARGLRDQCAAAGVPFLFKQWGEWHPEGSANYVTGPKEYRYGKVEGLSMMPSGAICLRNSADAPAGRPVVIDTEAMRAWHARVSRAEGNADAKNYPFGYQWMHRIGKKSAGRVLDGVTHNGFPGGGPS